jgi:nucleotide-binding universal stress UspA family protein
VVKVLIAVDETDESVAAAALARRLFGEDSEYLAINVFERPPPRGERDSSGLAAPMPGAPMGWGAVWPYRTVEPGGGEVGELTARDVAERDAREAAERAGLEDTELIREVGDPAQAILDAAHEHNVDVVVVGSHQRSWLSRLFSRSVSAQIVKRAELPVLVAK